MKCKVIITDEHDEEVVIYSREKNKLVEAIENLVNDSSFELIGYLNSEAVNLKTDEIYCFTVQNSKVYAITCEGRYQLRCRLYQLEERLSGDFVKINQSCIANIRKIERFDTSVSGTLTIKFRNGYKDYVSRRCFTEIKRRLDR